ncbi:MAG: hypothetical protein V1754_02220, partial [Pseudomonadota bacterium]
WVNPKYQLKWSLIIALIGGLSAGIFTALLWKSIDEENALIEKAIQSDGVLQTKSQDVLLLLLNMPNITEEETQKYRARFYEAKTRYENNLGTKKLLIAHNDRTQHWLIGFVILIPLCLFVWGIFLTHRVAGPLYVMKRQLEKLNEGGRIDLRPIRKGDEFQDLYQLFCRVLEKRNSADKQDPA